VALLLPLLIVVIVAFAWVFAESQDERSETAQLARGTVAADLLQDVQGQLATEISYLGALGALDEPWPAVLEYQRLTLDQLATTFERSELIDIARRADHEGAQAYRLLAKSGVRAPAGAQRAFQTVDETFFSELESGDPLASGRQPTIEAATYGAAWDWLLARYQGAQDRSRDAQRALVDRSADSTPPWRHPAVLGLALGVFALGIAIAFAFRMIVLRALHRVEQERDDRAEQAARLRRVLDAVREFAAVLDGDQLAARIVEQAAITANGDFAALFRVVGPQLVPLAAGGVATECSDATGLLTRVIDGGRSARAVITAEPGLLLAGTTSLVAAPLTSHGRVVAVVVAGRYAVELASEDDEAALTLLATCAAPALDAAREHGDVATLATIDPLTGLHNKRRLEHDLGAALEHGQRAQRPTALMMIDVDHFKRFNDTYGHPEGDRALRRIAAVVRACVREPDTVYRYGGEELCVLLPGAQLLDALTVAERIRASVAHDDDADGQTTVSIGVAHTLDGNHASLLQRADEALYAAKRGGRNRVEHATV